MVRIQTQEFVRTFRLHPSQFSRGGAEARRKSRGGEPNADSGDLVPPAFSSPPVPGGPSSDEAAFANVNRNHLDEAENRPLNSPPPRAPRLRVNRNFRFSILDFPFPILPSADSWLLNPYLLVPLNRGDKSAFLEIVRR